MFTIGTLLAVLKLKDSLSPALRKVQRNLQQTGAKIKQIGEGMRNTGASLTAGLTAPIVGMAAAAGVAFGTFESNMNRVRALTSATGNDFNKLSDTAKELGATTKFSASEAADAMGFLAMAGFESEQIVGTLPGVLQLATAATLGLADAADITTNIMTGYGREVSEVANTNNVLVKAFTSANTDLTQLGQAFKFVGPVAKSAGVSFEETTAVLALMGNAGIQASMAGTSLRGAISKLLLPTKAASETIHTLGLNVTKSNGDLMPMADIIDQLGTSGASTAQIMEIFGLRAGPAMAGLVQQGADKVRELTGELENVDDIAKRVADIAMEGLSGAFTKMRSAGEGALISVGELLAPALIKVADAGVRLSNWVSNVLVPAFQDLSPTMQMVIGGTVAFAAAIGPVLLVAGQMVITIGALVSAVGGGAGLIAALGSAVAFLTGPVGLVLAITAALMAFKPTRDILLNIASILVDVFGEAIRYSVDSWNLLIDGVTAFIKVIVDAAMSVDWIATAVQGLGKWIGIAGDKFGEIAEKTSHWGDTSRDVANNKLAVLNAEIERLTSALGEVIQDGSVEELNDAMIELGNAGGLTDDALGAIADRTRELMAENAVLTPGLIRVEAAFAAESAAIDPATAALEDHAVALGDLTDAVKSLIAEFDGSALAAEVNELETSWSLYTSTQDASSAAMLDAGKKALALQEAGAVLSGELLELANAAWIAEAPIPKLSTSFQTFGTALAAVPISSVTGMYNNLASSAGALIPGMTALTAGMTALTTVTQTQLDAMLKPAGLRDAIDDTAESLVQLAQIAGSGTFSSLLSGIATVVGGFSSALSGIDSFKAGLSTLRSAGGSLTSTLSGIAGMATGIGAIVPLAQMAWKGIKKLFSLGGPSETELAGRDANDAFKDFTQSIITNAGELQVNQLVAQGWARDLAVQVVAVGEQYIALGLTQEQANRDVQAVWDAIQDGPEAVEAAIAVINANVGGLSTELRTAEQAALDANTELANIQTSLHTMPTEELDATIERLVEMGVITAADAVAIRALGESSTVDFQAMEDAANRIGLELSELGPDFDQAKLNDKARSVMADFDLLAQNGANVGSVVIAIGDEINALVADAAATGSQIPANMQPVIAEMIRLGTLIDEDGQKITDIGQIEFAEPMVDSTQLIIDKLDELITEFLGMGTDAVDNADDASEALGVTNEAVLDIGDSLAGQNWRGWADDAIANANRVYEAVNKVSFGSNRRGAGQSTDITAVPHFGQGGVVPGVGPQVVVAHGGETVSTPQQRRSEGLNSQRIENRLERLERAIDRSSQRTAEALVEAMA